MKILLVVGACVASCLVGVLIGVFIERRSSASLRCVPPEPVQQRFEPGSRLKLEHVPSPLVSTWRTN